MMRCGDRGAVRFCRDCSSTAANANEAMKFESARGSVDDFGTPTIAQHLRQTAKQSPTDGNEDVVCTSARQLVLAHRV